MEENEFVQVKLPNRQPVKLPATKAFQMRLDENKTLTVYNHIQSYILEALLKAVMSDAH